MKPRKPQPAADTQTLDSARIARTAWEASRQLFPGITSIDKLLCSPDSAIAVCKKTNLILNRKLEREEICTALLNARKRGDLK